MTASRSSFEQTRYFKEYRRPDGTRDTQNRSIQGWIMEGTEFEFDLHIVNLSGVELGALAWLLQLPESHFHRFGGSKPLGFGSVRVEMIDQCSEVRTGSEWASYYLSLDESDPTIHLNICVTAYQLRRRTGMGGHLKKSHSLRPSAGLPGC